MSEGWGRRIAAVMVAGLLLGACSGGGSDEETSTGGGGGAETTEASGDDTTSTTEADQVVMPDLLGQTEDEARTALLDRGVEDSVILVDERESLEEAGTIIDQVPSSGQRISGSVNLIVAKPVGPVPDFVGMEIAEVEAWAEERGIGVRIEEVLDDAKADGEVLTTTPAAGEDATSEILVEVARTPVIGALAEVEPIERDCYEYATGEAEVNGTPLADSLIVQSVSGSCIVEFNLGRDWSRFKSTIGLSDDSTSGARYRFEVFADDTSLFNEVVGIGQEMMVDEDVSGALRLRLQLTPVGAEYDYDSYGVWGDARVIGSPDAVAEEPGEGDDSTTTTTE